jgi:zeaxanthin glucosyltransferase
LSVELKLKIKIFTQKNSMKHFGIICPTALGHLNPMTALGCELQKRGHRVTLIGIEDVRPNAIAAKLEFQAIGKSDRPSEAKSLVAQYGELGGFQALKYSVQWMVAVANTVLRDTPEVIRTTGIEALLIDQASPEGGTVAQYLDIPFVSICNAILLNQDTNVPPVFTSWNYDPTWRGMLRNKIGHALLNQVIKPTTKTIQSYRQQWNLPDLVRNSDAYSPLAQIAQQPGSFEFPRKELPSCFHFIGPFSNPMSRDPVSFPYEELTGQPLIYASLGTLQNKCLWIFQAIAHACVGLDVQLIISLGGATPESLPEFSANPIVVDYAPQLELLPKAALTITHAGMNTVLESLSNAVPMVAIPIANDQPGVAARIAWTGTGEVIPLKKVSVKNLRRTIKRVLREDSYKKNALKLQESIKQAGGVSKAVDIIEQVAATGKPVLAHATN